MIRKANLNDIFSIVKIEKETLNSTLGEKFLYNELSFNPFAHYFVYDINEEIKGYIGLRIVDENVDIMNFAVKNSCQNKGIGTEIMNYILKYVKKFNVKLISLEVRKTNTKAIRFYKKYGFIKSYVRKNYYENNEDALVYIKEV